MIAYPRFLDRSQTPVVRLVGLGNAGVNLADRISMSRSLDIETLTRICRFASNGMTICPLGDAFSLPISSMVAKFRAEFEARIATAQPLPAKKFPVLPWVGPGQGF